MAAYASLATVRRLLGSESGADDGRIQEVNATVSLLIDEWTGRTYDAVSGDVSRTLAARGGAYLTMPAAYGPLRTVTTVTIAGTPLVSASRRLALRSADNEFWAIERIDGQAWPDTAASPVVVTGGWANIVVGVPADVAEAAAMLVAGLVRLDKASPIGAIGPDGFESAVRDVRKDHRITGMIERQRIKRWLAA